MYNRHKWSMMIFFLIIFILSLSFEFKVNKESVNNLITFFSIIFGFYLTASSVLYGSKFSLRLSNEEDKLINTQTKLHTLKKYFHFSSIVSIISTTMLVIIGMLNWTIDSKIDSKESNNIFSEIFVSFCLGLSAVNIVLIFILLKIFFNAFVEEV